MGCERCLPNFPISGGSEQRALGGVFLLTIKRRVIWHFFLMCKDSFEDRIMGLAVGEKNFLSSGQGLSLAPSCLSFCAAEPGSENPVRTASPPSTPQSRPQPASFPGPSEGPSSEIRGEWSVAVRSGREGFQFSPPPAGRPLVCKSPSVSWRHPGAEP